MFKHRNLAFITKIDLEDNQVEHIPAFSFNDTVNLEELILYKVSEKFGLFTERELLILEQSPQYNSRNIYRMQSTDQVGSIKQ